MATRDEPDLEGRDEVDTVVGQWAIVRPDADLESIGIFGRIDRVQQSRSIRRRRLLSSHGLSAAAFDVLSSLRRADVPYRSTAGELARAAQLTSGAITFRLDRLEADGLVRRGRDGGDRRVIVVELTDAGRELVDAVFEDYIALEAEMLGDLTREERSQLTRLLRRLVLAQQRSG